MSDAIIKVENLSKSYTIRHQNGERYTALRDVVSNSVKGISKRLMGRNSATYNLQSATSEEFWALNDVSFEVKQGERVGIIGRNGAGKSTLLKILSRITEPTSGRIRIKGRVASLLEVGTGFHPELTGRENIYLNGAILGMYREEIRRKFDEIVAFAEVEKFLDTPVKRYSSGMYVRLAFAVAAHLEPEILLIDEVLAVGDVNFQKKCLGKINDVAKEGRTVLFVSHNMAAIANLCPRSILLDSGKLALDAISGEVTEAYLELGSTEGGKRIWTDLNTAPGNEKLRLRSVCIICEDKITPDVEINKEIKIQIEFLNYKPDVYRSVSIHLLDKMGVEVLASANMHSANLERDEWFDKPLPVGLYQTVCVLPANFLNEGRYSLNVLLFTGVTNVEIFMRDVVSFIVHDTGEMRQEYMGAWPGVVRPKLLWQTQLLSNR